jgi:hypothetical protein
VACKTCTIAAIEEAINDLKKDSSPGVPWCTLGSTNAQVIEAKDIITGEVVARLLDICKLGDELFRLSPEELIKRNICDPVKVFIKDEPHKLKKISSDKLRLISNIAVVDQIIDRLLFKDQNSIEIENWETCPSKPGIGLNDEGLLTIAGNLRELLSVNGQIRSTDISGWDWSVQGWELDADAQCRIQLAGASEGSLFSFLVRARVHCIKNKVFALPDGRLVAQVGEGIQASGSLNTSSTNSRMRILVKLVAWIIFCNEQGVDPVRETVGSIAMGDDSDEVREDDRINELMEELGHSIKEETVTSGVAGSGFCSHTWRNDGLAEPDNVYKTLFRYFSHPPDSTTYLEWYAQLRNDLRNLSGSEKIFQVARAHAECAKSKYGCTTSQQWKEGPPAEAGSSKE